MIPSTHVKSLILDSSSPNQNYKCVKISFRSGYMCGKTFMVKEAPDHSLFLAGGLEVLDAAREKKPKTNALKERLCIIAKPSTASIRVGSLSFPYLESIGPSRQSMPLLDLKEDDQSYILKLKSYKSFARTQRELAIATRIDHPNIVKVHGFTEVNRLPAIIMEKVQGTDGVNYIQKYGPVLNETFNMDKVANLDRLETLKVHRAANRFAHAIELIKEVASAIEYLDSKNIVHRDLKPENIVISGGDWSKPQSPENQITCKVIDLEFLRYMEKPSISSSGHLIQPEIERLRSCCGSALWMAPEMQQVAQSRSQATSTSSLLSTSYGNGVDHFGVGAIFHSLIAGSYLYLQDTNNNLVYSPQSYDWRLPNEFKGALYKLLHPDPSQRLSVEEFLNCSLFEADFEENRRCYIKYIYTLCREEVDCALFPPELMKT